MEGGRSQAKYQKLDKSKYVYTKCYCEENIWNLCSTFKESDGEYVENYAVFISNENKTVPFFEVDGRYVVWDYHVIFIRKTAEGSLVMDFDAESVDFPCPFKVYCKVVLNSSVQLRSNYQRMFRVLEANEFLKNFSSDRSHMLKNGKWLAHPPNYPCIQIEGIATNLFSDFVDMKNEKFGKVMAQKEFINFFSEDLESLK